MTTVPFARSIAPTTPSPSSGSVRFALAVVGGAIVQLVPYLRADTPALLAIAYLLFAALGAGFFAGHRPWLAGALSVLLGAALYGVVSQLGYRTEGGTTLGDFFTADPFHTRDAVRQTAVDWMMLVRYLRTFDGTTTLLIAGANQPNLRILNGDFNGDGIPDVAGPVTWPVQLTDQATVPNRTFKQGDPNPGSDLFAFGLSLGGIVAGVLPAVEPAVKAAVPVSGGAGLADVAIRSQLAPLVNAIFLGAIGPFFTTCDFDFALGRCAPGGTPTLVLVARDVTRESELPVAALTLAPGDRLTVTNLSSTSDSCARDHACATATADASGKARVGVIATGAVYSAQGGTAIVAQPGDRLQVGVLRSTGTEPRNIDTFGFDTSFAGAAFHAGDPLTAPAQGWGYERNTPEFRRLMQLWQAVVEPGDPISYAPNWTSDLLDVRNAVPLLGQIIAQDHPERLSSLVLSATWPGRDPYFRRLFESRREILVKLGVHSLCLSRERLDESRLRGKVFWREGPGLAGLSGKLVLLFHPLSLPCLPIVLVANTVPLAARTMCSPQNAAGCSGS